jgi:oxygen-independent coproporphyrinogen-3 oxidase
VWNIDLRGHGVALRNPQGRRQRPGWTLDTYGTQDLPAVFDYVQRETEISKIAYVGHSMGGMVLSIYLAHHPDPPLSAAVLVGSPLRFDDPDLTVQTMLTGAPLFRHFAFLPTPLLARMLSHVRESLPIPVAELLYNPDNIEPQAARKMLRKVVSPLSRGEISHFASIGDDGHFRSVDGSLDYAVAMREVDLPILFLAGRADRIAAPDRVWSFFNDLGTQDKKFEVLSVANGCRVNYGHLDFGVGDSVEKEVFPRILEWFGRHQ